MESITDKEALAQRIEALFQTMKMPGLSGYVRELSYEAGMIILDFEVAPSLASPLGFLHGGAVMTLLDACIAMAGVVKSGGILAMPLVEMKTSFVRPVLAGKLVGKGETIHLGRRLAFIEGTLFSPSGDLLARASGTVSPKPWPGSES